MTQLNLIARARHPVLVFVLSLVLLGCGSGGNSGSSSGCSPDGIPELQGLWIQQNGCSCSVADQRNERPTRCFFYIEGSKAVSGYLKATPDYSRCDSTNYASTLTQGQVDRIVAEARQYELDSAKVATDFAAAAGTFFCRGPRTATLNGERVPATGLDYRASGTAASSGRSLVCSAFWRDGPILYLGKGQAGVPQDQNDEARCDAQRYTELEPYFQPD